MLPDRDYLVDGADYSARSIRANNERSQGNPCNTLMSHILCARARHSDDGVGICDDEEGIEICVRVSRSRRSMRGAANTSIPGASIG